MCINTTVVGCAVVLPVGTRSMACKAVADTHLNRRAVWGDENGLISTISSQPSGLRQIKDQKHRWPILAHLKEVG
jgi:hypothetical protein